MTELVGPMMTRMDEKKQHSVNEALSWKEEGQFLD